MDCHTPWCDGCRRMKKNVFTDEAVIRFFGSNFINVTVDMAQGEGKVLAKKYNIHSFPALLFLDAKGKIRHMVIGYCPAAEFITEGQRAMDPGNCLQGMMKRFKKGERSLEFLADYLGVLRRANKIETKDIAKLYVDRTGLKQRFEAGERGSDFMEKFANVLEIAKVDEYLQKYTPEYLALLPVEQMATGRNWQWIKYYSALRFTDAVRKVADHSDLFLKVAGGIDHVNQIVDQALRQEMFYYMLWLYDSEFIWNEQEFEAFLQYLYRLDSPVASKCFIQLTALKNVVRGDYEGLLKNMRRILTYNTLSVSSDYNYYRDFFTALKRCPDVKRVKEGISLIDDCIREKVPEKQREKWETLKLPLVKRVKESENK